MAGRLDEFNAGFQARMLRQTGGFSLRNLSTAGLTGPSQSYLPGFSSQAELQQTLESHGASNLPSMQYGTNRRMISARAAQATGQGNLRQQTHAWLTNPRNRLLVSNPKLGQSIEDMYHWGRPGVGVRSRIGAFDQQRQMHMRLAEAGFNAGRSSAHRLYMQGYEPMLPGQREVD